MKQLVIAISGMNATDNPGPGVGVARSLRESSLSDLRIIGLCYGSMESGAYLNDIVDASYLLPYPSEGVQPFLERLLYIHEKEHVDIVIPNLDAELFTFIKIRIDWLRRESVCVYPPWNNLISDRNPGCPSLARRRDSMCLNPLFVTRWRICSPH